MTDLIELTAGIVASYVQNNSVPTSEIAALIAGVHAAMGSLGEPQAQTAPKPPPLATSAQIRKSISDDFLISFIDGKPYRTLKRHIQTQGLTVAGYRTKYGLPQDYPITAKSTSLRRQATAFATGLGRKPATRPVTAKPARKARSTAATGNPR